MQTTSGRLDLATGTAIPAAEITAILQRRRGTVALAARLRVVDMFRNPVAVMPESDRFPDRSDISLFMLAAGGDATVVHDSTQPVHRSLHFTMLDPTSVPALGTTSFPFNPFHHLIQASQVIAANGVSFEVSLGYFVMAFPSATTTPGGRVLTWEGLDLTAFISMAPILSDWTVTTAYAGGYRQAAIDLITVDSTPASRGGSGRTPSGNDDAGPAIPASMIDVPSTPYNRAVPADMLFQPGTNRLDACTQLWTATRHKPWAMRHDGTFESGPMPYFGSIDTPSFPTAGWDYSNLPGTSLISGPVEQSFASQGNADFANTVKVEGSRPASSTDAAAATPAFAALLINDSPDSLISTANLRNLQGGPRAVSRYIRDDKIADADMAQVIAQLALQQGAQKQETITVGTLANPLHEDLDVLICQIEQNGRVVIPSTAASPWLETGWSLPLCDPAGIQSHTLVRAVAL